MNRVNSDRLPVKAEAHQRWPPKTQKNGRVASQKRQKKRKRKNTLLYIKGKVTTGHCGIMRLSVLRK